MKKSRVFLIDDHSVLRQGLRLLLDRQPDMEVVGEAEQGRGAASAIERAGGAEVVVLDISLADTTGLAVAGELRAAFPLIRIIALTRHSEKAYVQQMMRRGANGYVLKQTGSEALIAAIRAVVVGGTYLDPAIAGKTFEAPPAVRAMGGDELTPREREVLTMVAWGHTNKEIASTLGITVKTVETHKTNGMRSLGITSRAELVRFAISQGWLQRTE
jgi:DNA-binding NarL/FixJ family response regulator